MAGWIDVFNPNVPTTYTEALSYLEQLERNYRRMDEAIGQLKVIREELKNEIQSAMQLLRKEMEARVFMSEDTLRKEMMVQDELWNKVLQAHKEEIFTDINIINGRISAMQEISDERFKNVIARLAQMGFDFSEEVNSINSDFLKLKNDFLGLLGQFTDFKFHAQNQIDSELASMRELIEAQIERINGDIIIVTNPLSGQRETLKATLSAIAEWKQPIPIRFEDYNKMKIKFEDYNEMKITFRDYNNFAGLIFWKRLHIGIWDDRFAALEKRLSTLESVKWRDLVTMQDEPPETAYRNLANEVFGLAASPITFQDYNDLDLDFEAFNAMEIPAKKYNLYGVDGKNLQERVSDNEKDIISAQKDVEELKIYHQKEE